MSSDTLTPARPEVEVEPAPAGEALLDGDIVVDIRDLSKCYRVYPRPSDRVRQALLGWRRRYHREFWALRGVNLQIRRGEAIGVIGRNGSGKSTLMQLIAGVLTPTQGEVRVRGRVDALLELGSAFNPEFTGRENIYLYGSILGLRRREVDERFDDIAGFADIGDFLDQPVKTYSSGMKVRLAFSVQVQLDPEILVIDEALSVGDNLFQKRCHQRLKQLREDDGVTLLFVSHQQEVIRTITTRAVLLHEGLVRAVGPPGDVVLEYRRLLHEEEKRWSRGQARTLASQSSVVRTPRKPAPVNDNERVLSFGDEDAIIECVEVLDDVGDPCSLLRSGDPLRIRVRGRVRTDLTHLNVAIRIRNKEGVKIYSWGTLNQDIETWASEDPSARPEVFWDRQFRAGDAFCVDFCCACRLGAGFYEVQAMVAEERDRYYEDERMLHWVDEAAFFTVRVVRDEYFFGGVCDLEMEARFDDDV